MKRIATMPSTRKKTLLLFAFLFVFSGAQSGYANTNLPFGLSWGSSVVEYVEALQKYTNSSDYSITEASRDGIYLVRQPASQSEESIAYSAQFRGPSTTTVIKERELRDLDRTKLDFEWMGISFPSIGSEKNFDDFLSSDVLSAYAALHQQFEQDYGISSAQYSYINIKNQNGAQCDYQIPKTGEAIDYPLILNFLSNNINGMDTFWLVAGNGNASCRLYLTTTQRRDGSAGLIWRLSYFFTQEKQKTSSSVSVLAGSEKR